MPRIIWTVAVLSTLAAACGDGGSPGAFRPCTPTHIVEDGDRLPDCTFERMGGGSISLAALRGKPVILNFWTSWCPSCVKEMPALQDVADAYGGRVQVVGMDGVGVLGEKKTDAEEFATKKGVRYPIGFDVDGLLYSHFFGSIRSRPTYPLTLYVDDTGTIRKTAFGEQAREDLRENIRTLFGIDRG